MIRSESIIRFVILLHFGRSSSSHPVIFIFQILSAGKLGQLYSIDHCLRVLRQRDDTFRKCCIELRGTKENTLRFNIMKMKAAKKVSTAINYDL